MNNKEVKLQFSRMLESRKKDGYDEGLLDLHRYIIGRMKYFESVDSSINTEELRLEYNSRLDELLQLSGYISASYRDNSEE